MIHWLCNTLAQQWHKSFDITMKTTFQIKIAKTRFTYVQSIQRVIQTVGGRWKGLNS